MKAVHWPTVTAFYLSLATMIIEEFPFGLGDEFA